MRRRRGELPPPRRPGLNAYRLAKFAGRIFNERSEPEWREVAREDWRAFIDRRFKLTDAERDALAAIDEEVVAQIAETVRELIRSGGELEVTLPEGRKGGELVFSRGAGTARRRAASAVVLRCSFDANCRNWKCRAG
jgi:hypothetical protein